MVKNSIILDYHFGCYRMHSDIITIGQIIVLRSSLCFMQRRLDFGSQMSLRDPVLRDMVRGIDEPSTQYCQQRFLDRENDNGIPLICHLSDLIPGCVVQENVVALQDHYTRGCGHANIMRYRVLLCMIETWHPDVLRWIVFVRDRSATQRANRLNEKLCVKCERCSSSTECFIGIFERGQDRFCVMIAVL